MNPPTTTAAAPQHISVEREGDVATLTFLRPAGRNSFDVATLDAFCSTVQALVHDESVRVVVFVGDERAFCAGGDVKEMMEQEQRAAAHFDDLTSRYHLLLSMMRESDTVFVAAFRGIAAGGGVGLLLSHDLVVAADDARIVTAYANLGVSPDGGVTSHLVRAIGPHRTRHALLIDDGISADQMVAWGLANRIVPAADVVEEARALARAAASRSRHTRLWAKRLVEEAAHAPYAQVLERERQAIMEGAGTSALTEGLAAFREKRPPRFA